MKLIFHVFLGLVALIPYSLLAQESGRIVVFPEKDREFQSAVLKYRSGDPRGSYIDFEILTNAKPLHQLTTASLLMAGASLYQIGRYPDAILYFDRLIDKFPQSRYRDDAIFFGGASRYLLGDYFDSVKRFLEVLDGSSESELVEESTRLVRSIIRNRLTLSESQNLLRHANRAGSAGIVTIELARRELKEGSSVRVVKLLKDYRSKFGAGPYSDQIEQLLKEAEGVIHGIVKIGVLLPLTGPFREEGLGILRGIRFAHDNTVAENGPPVQLIVRDSGSNMIKAIRATRNLLERERVQAIIGELESEMTAGIGALASGEGVPVLSPSATENDVASVGQAVYQLNSDLRRKGQALAEYAFRELGHRTFATLAPGDDYGQQMTASFSSHIDELGGRIIAQSWYYGSPQDVTRQFTSLRQAAFHFDSTDVEKLIEEAEENGEKLEEKDIPVLSIDAVFFPVYSEDIPYIAPQFAFSNIRSQILGGEYWDDAEYLNRALVQQYVNGSIFISDFFPDEQSHDFRDFRTRFRLKMKKTPERWEVFGYDAYQVLISALKKGVRTGIEINKGLNGVEDYRGIKGKITFRGNHRVNNEVNFLQFVNGSIIKHELSR